MYVVFKQCTNNITVARLVWVLKQRYCRLFCSCAQTSGAII